MARPRNNRSHAASEGRDRGSDLAVTAGELHAGAGVGRLGFRVRAWGDVMRVLLGLLLIAIVGCGDGSSPPGGGAVPTRGDPVSASLAEFIKGKRIHFQELWLGESFWCDFAANGATQHSARGVGTFKVDGLKVAVLISNRWSCFFPRRM